MLQQIRKASRGWVAWVIVIGLSIPFALFGIDQFSYGPQGDSVIATLGNHDITYNDYYTALQTQQGLLQQRFGDEYERLNHEEIRREVWQQVLGRAILFASAKDKGFIADNNVIRMVVQSNAEFQTDGEFDQDKYQRYLSANGFSPKYYEAKLKHQTVLNHYMQGYFASNLITDYELQNFYQMNHHNRQFAYVVLPWNGVSRKVKVENGEIAARYEETKENFRVPLTVKAQYLKLNVADLDQEISVTEQQLRDFFEDRITEFSEEEKRNVRHILFDKEDVELANKVLFDIRAGKDFSRLAKKYSQDFVSAKDGGNLGEISRGDMVESFDETSFDLQLGEISKLVETEFGYHIIEVTDIQQAKNPIFAELKDQVEESYRKNELVNYFYKQQQRLSELSFEQSDGLDIVAEEMNLTIQQTDWFSREEGTTATITANEAFRNAAFSSSVLNNNENSRVLQLSADEITVLRILGKKESFIKPLAQVRAEVKQSILQEKSIKLLQEQTDKQLQKLDKGSLTWKSFAKSVKYNKFSEPKLQWLGLLDISEEESAEHLEAYTYIFDTIRVRKKRKPKGVYSSKQTKAGDLLVFYQKDSRDVKVKKSVMQESESNQTLMSFYEQNSRTQTLEVLQEKYPLPNVDLNEVNKSMGQGRY